MTKDSDILLFNNIKKDVRYTGVGDRSSNCKLFFLKDLPKGVAENQSRVLKKKESDSDSQGDLMENFYTLKYCRYIN